jgi:hypothetical protein
MRMACIIAASRGLDLAPGVLAQQEPMRIRTYIQKVQGSSLPQLSTKMAATILIGIGALLATSP